MMRQVFGVLVLCVLCIECKRFNLREVSDMAQFPENTPASRFFKQAFARLDEGDVKSLAIVMKEAYLKLCTTLYGCNHVEAELEELYQLRYNELEINSNKMRKLGFLFQRLVAGV
jgi:hypothetical protein